MSFSGIVTKENVKSPELRGMKCKERPRHFFFFLEKVSQELAKTEVPFHRKKFARPGYYLPNISHHRWENMIGNKAPSMLSYSI